MHKILWACPIDSAAPRHEPTHRFRIFQGARGEGPLIVLVMLTTNQLYVWAFGKYCNVAKGNLGKVNLKPMQSAVAPISVRDLRGDP